MKVLANTATLKTFLCLVFVIVLILISVSWACSMSPGYTLAGPVPEPGALLNDKPKPPVLKILNFRRGYDDGNTGSCSDLAMLSLELLGDHAPGDSYHFESRGEALPEGAIPARRIRPVEFPDGSRGFRFGWLEGSPGQIDLPEIDATLVVTRVATTGVHSDPINILVRHRGGPVQNFAAQRMFVNVAILTLGLIVAVLLYARFRRQQAQDRIRLRHRFSEKVSKHRRSRP